MANVSKNRVNYFTLIVAFNIELLPFFSNLTLWTCIGCEKNGYLKDGGERRKSFASFNVYL